MEPAIKIPVKREGSSEKSVSEPLSTPSPTPPPEPQPTPAPDPPHEPAPAPEPGPVVPPPAESNPSATLAAATTFNDKDVSPGQVVVGGFTGTDSQGPVVAPPPADPQDIPSFGAGIPKKPILSKFKPAKTPPKKWLYVGLSVLLVLVGVAGFYFGYYNNPSVIYSQSLSNTGKGYDKLMEYVEKESSKDYKGYEFSGSYKYSLGMGISAEGELKSKAYDNNSITTLSLEYDKVNIKGEARTIKTDGKTPDVYVKASGLSEIGSLLGTPEVDNVISKVNDQWVFIDHQLFEALSQQASGGAEEPETPGKAEVLDALKAFGEVNKDYVYTTKKDKAVLRVVEKKGGEEVDGHNTYRYEVGFNKENVKKYIDAQKKAMAQSKMGDWLKKNNYQDDVNKAFDDMKESANEIKEKDTFDIWMDTKTRLVYKVRVSEEAKSYTDIGLDYKGGDDYPFFIAGKADSFKAVFTATLNAKTNSIDFDISASDASGAGSFSFESSYQPNNDQVKVEKPTNAKSFDQLMQELGYGEMLAQLRSGSINQGIQSKARNTQRQADIASVQAQLEAFYAEYGYYPTAAHLNDVNWRKANMKGLDNEAIKDPSATNDNFTFTSTPGPNVYSYAVTNSAGGSCESDEKSCTKYTLTATFEGEVNGQTTYVKKNLD